MTFIPKKHIPSIFIAFVFIQSLFFKFTGSYETDHIFGTLGEWSGIHWFGVYGGYLIGIAELIAAILLFTRFHGVGSTMVRWDYDRSHFIPLVYAARCCHA